MKKNPKKFSILILLIGSAWAADTDAEIIKDLDFFMALPLVREESVFSDSSAIDEPAAGQGAENEK